MADMDEGSRGGRRSVLVFGIVAAIMTVLLIACRRRRQKRGTEHGAVEHRVAGNQRLAEPVTKCRGFLSWSGPVENGAAHGDGERLYLFEQGRFSRHDLPARAADRLSGAVGVVSKLRAGSCVSA